MKKALPWGVLAVLVIVSLWWLIAPPRSETGYREEAAKSAESLISHLETAQLWAEGIDDREVTHQAALVGLREAESDANGTTSSFESVQPPPGQTDLRSAYSALAGDASDVLSRMRIAARRGDWDRVPRERDALHDVTQRLDDFVSRARP